MVPKTRLGKRSPLGTLVCGSSADGLTETGPHGCPESGFHRSKLYPGQKVSIECLFCCRVNQKMTGILSEMQPVHGVFPDVFQVYVHCGGQECGGVVEQHNHVDNEVSIFLPQLNQHVHRKLEDVWTNPTSSPNSSVSSSIDVPRRYGLL